MAWSLKASCLTPVFCDHSGSLKHNSSRIFVLISNSLLVCIWKWKQWAVSTHKCLSLEPGTRCTLNRYCINSSWIKFYSCEVNTDKYISCLANLSQTVACIMTKWWKQSVIWPNDLIWDLHCFPLQSACSRHRPCPCDRECILYLLLSWKFYSWVSCTLQDWKSDTCIPKVQ